MQLLVARGTPYSQPSCTKGGCTWVLGTVKPCLYSSVRTAQAVAAGLAPITRRSFLVRRISGAWTRHVVAHVEVLVIGTTRVAAAYSAHGVSHQLRKKNQKVQKFVDLVLTAKTSSRNVRNCWKVSWPAFSSLGVAFWLFLTNCSAESNTMKRSHISILFEFSSPETLET